MSFVRAAGPRLLIIDDEEAISFAMWDYFGRSGYRVDRARTREEAEALLAGPEPFDLVIADLRLSAHDPRGGLDLLRQARARFPGVRIILLTAYGSSEVEAELARFGDARLLSKPQPLPCISQEVARLLASQPGAAHASLL
ncbi:MAG TPA: response regulator [Thermoanaerobaculia bacterium]|jgi:DNA-binding NtrC family response regulator|nr:response regulator [Thermoanaerobaculia bacterium]